MNALVAAAPYSAEPTSEVARDARNAAAAALVTEAERTSLLAQAWAAAIERCLHDGVLSVDQEQRLVELADELAIPRAALEQNGSWERIVKGAVLRDLLNDVIPHRMHVDGGLGLNLQKNEQIVWVFKQVRFLEDRVFKEYVGGSRGVSVRVAKGVYYRIGSHRGHTVEHTSRVLVDTGLLAVTDKHIYFAGPRTSQRVPFRKIVSFEPFSDGLGIIREGVRAKPQVFATGDGWFTHNLVTNLARLA